MPPELPNEHASPGASRSITVTRWPTLRSANAVARPTIPAPITTVSANAAPPLGADLSRGPATRHRQHCLAVTVTYARVADLQPGSAKLAEDLPNRVQHLIVLAAD